MGSATLEAANEILRRAYGPVIDALLSRASDEGEILTSESAAALAFRTMHPISHKDEWYVPAIDGMDALKLLERLTSRTARVRCPARNELLSRGLKDAGWHLLGHVTAKALSARQPTADDGIRPATSDDDDFVRRLLTEAIIGGLAPLEKIDASAVSGYVVATYTPVQSMTRHSLVLWHDGERVGHATWEESVWDEISGEESELIDIFVLPTYRGMGGAHRLSREVEARCIAAGGSRLTGTVVEQPGSQALLASLVRAGWVRDHEFWVRFG
ncbi:MAG: GNAT family N-acetyltransferase [Chloroflexi bacterium]|nr:MAG: GNAT family N-acetyltransferase [Chloroflexota bacterium]